MKALSPLFVTFILLGLLEEAPGAICAGIDTYLIKIPKNGMIITRG